MDDNIRLRLVGKNVALGLGGVAVGALLMAALAVTSLSVDSVPSLLLGLTIVAASCAAILGGSAALFCCVREECARCEQPLECFTTRFSETVYDDLVARVRTASASALAGVAELPSPPSAAPEVAALQYEVCPSCNRSGRVMAYRMRWDAVSSRYEPYDRAEPADVAGWPMEQLVRAGEVRGARPPRAGETRDEL